MISNRRSARKLLLAVGMAALLPGCESLHRNIENPARVDPVTVAVYDPPLADSKSAAGSGAGKTGVCAPSRGLEDIYHGSVNLDCFKFPDDDELAYKRAATSSDVRDRLASALLKHSDDVCTREMGRVSALDAATNSTLSIAGTALSTAASIVGGEKAKSILAGGSTFFNSSRDHINAHVYRAQLTQAITLAISSERATLRKAIVGNFRKPVTNWTVDEAIREVNHYHQQCSFYRGLELLTAAAKEKEELGRLQEERAVDNEIDAITAELAQLRAEHKASAISDFAAREKALLDRRAELRTRQGQVD